jgi:hypothetical protein
MTSQTTKALLLIAVTALLTYFITCYFCNPKTIDVPDKDRSATICSNYETEPPVVLTTDLVKSMVGTYGSNQLENIQNAPVNPVPEDAQSIWFDLETLKKFMYQIEYNVNKYPAQSENKKIGVRIYYAAYPKNALMRDFANHQTDPNFSYNPDYENKHTLVMIPTITGADGNNYDFNPLDVNSYDGFASMSKKLNINYISDTYSTLILGPGAVDEVDDVGNTSARNHGTLAPPETIIGLSF